MLVVVAVAQEMLVREVLIQVQDQVVMVVEVVEVEINLTQDQLVMQPEVQEQQTLAAVVAVVQDLLLDQEMQVLVEMVVQV